MKRSQHIETLDLSCPNCDEQYQAFAVPDEDGGEPGGVEHEGGRNPVPRVPVRRGWMRSVHRGL